MTLRLNFNASAIRAQVNLQAADRLLGRSSQRLSSGLRLNRSADDPAALSIANALRYQLRGVQTATDNVENGINMISSAEGALDEVNTLLNRMRGLALSAANEGANDAPQLLALQRDFNESLDSINRIADNTQFGSIKLLNGNLAQNTFDRSTFDTQNKRATDYYQSLSQDFRLLQNGIIPGSSMEIGPPSGDLARSTLQVNFGAGTDPQTTISSSSQGGIPLGSAVGRTTTIEGPLGSLRIDISATTTLASVRDRINGSSGITGLRANYDQESGDFIIESTVFGATPIRVTSSDDMGGGQGLFDSDVTDPDVNSFFSQAANQEIQLTYEDRQGSQIITLVQDPDLENGLGFRDAGGAFTLIMKDSSDGSLGSSVEAPDMSYSATRENPDRVMIGPQGGQHTLLEIPDIHSKVLGQGANHPNFPNLDALRSALRDGNSQAAIEIIDAAIEQIGQIRGRLGALQASSLESTAAYLRINSENLSASEGRIRDTDFAQESAEFTRQQTLLQAATAMLAQANQIPDRVLQLLG